LEENKKRENSNLGFKFFEKNFCYFSGAQSVYDKEINANTHHLWNDDDENDEYFTPFETKKTKRDYYSHYDYFDEQ
tara:strand:+ start:923 stop:1150 length:228 start_codon:yes stop_codon:yes gene_type:complete